MQYEYFAMYCERYDYCLSIIVETLPRRVIVTDDPLRARMLSAHHLEYSTLVYEAGDILVFSGSYKNVPIALASTGFGSGAILSYLHELKELGAAEVVYVGGCVSTTDRYGLRTLVLAAGGSRGLLRRASTAARLYNIPTTTLTVLSPVGIHPEEGCAIEDSAIEGCAIEGCAIGGSTIDGSTIEGNTIEGSTIGDSTISGSTIEGHIIDDVTGAFYEQARADGIEALTILTVSENIKTGEKMEEHEKRSRFYAAARLVFEMLATN